MGLEFKIKQGISHKQLLLDVHRRLKRLSMAGITVSIVCGKPLFVDNVDYFYSVNVLTKDLDEFEKPFACHTILQAIEIAEKECKERGWYIPNNIVNI